MFGRKKKIKLEWEVTIQRVEWTFGYTKLAGQPMKLEWKRGDKEKGKTKSMALEEGADNLPFLTKIKIPAHVAYDGDIENLKTKEKKLIVFTLITEDGKKGKDLTVGKADLDLITCLIPGKFEEEQTVKMLGKEKKPRPTSPTLVLTVKADWLKVNGKKVVKKEETDSSSSKKSKKKKSSSSDLLERSGSDSLLEESLDTPSAFGKKNKKFKDRKKMTEEDFLAEQESETITVGGHELVLEEPDPDEISLSEADSQWEGEDRTENDYMSDEDWKDDPDAPTDEIFDEDEVKIQQPSLPKHEASIGAKKKGLSSSEEDSDSKNSFTKKPALVEEPASSSNRSGNSKHDVSGESSGEESPRFATNNSKPKAETKDAPKETTKTSTSSKAPAKEETSQFSRKDISATSASQSKDTSKNSKGAAPPAESKRGKGPVIAATTTTVASGTGKPKAKKSSDKASDDDAEERIRILEFKLDCKETIALYIYGSAWEYSDGQSVNATRLADFMVKETEAFHKVFQFDEQNRDLFIDVIIAIYRQYTKYDEDLSTLSGWLVFSITLMQSIMKQVPADFLKAPGSKEAGLKWCLTIAKNGLQLATSNLTQINERMGNVEMEDEYNSLAQAAGSPVTAFMQTLDLLISHNFAMLVTAVKKKLDALRYVDIFFDPDSISGTPKKKAKALKKLAHVTTILDSFVQQAVYHKFPKSLEAQVLAQVFFYLNATMVNSLIGTPMLCRAAIAFSIKSALSHIEEWTAKTFGTFFGGPTAPSTPTRYNYVSWMQSQLDCSREAANLMEIQKTVFNTGIDEVKTLFTALNIPQIAKLLSQFKPDEYATDTTPDGALRLFEKAAAGSKDKLSIDANVFLRIPASQ